MVLMDIDYKSANALHVLFVVTDRTACLSKLFADGNNYTRYGLPSRLLDV